nr:pilus assembly PilX N-terminal domain-containing protein [Lysinibacillus timonensis]
MLKRWLPLLNSNNGYALLFVILTIAVSSILGVSLIHITSGTILSTSNERIDQSAYYIAEAGLNIKKAQLNSYLQDAYQETQNEYNKLGNIGQKQKFDFEERFLIRAKSKIVESTITIENFEKNFGMQPFANVKLTHISDSPLKYNITSTGTIGLDERTLTQTVTVTLNAETTIVGNTKQYSGDYAIHARKSITTSGSLEITGTVAVEKKSPSETTQEAMNRISIKNGNITKSATYNSIFDPSLLVGDLLTLPYPREFPNGILSIYHDYTLTLRDNMRLDEISVNRNDTTFTIDVGNSDRELYVNEFNLNKTDLVIVGSGRLILHIGDEFTTNSQTSLNCPSRELVHGMICGGENPNKLTIIHHGNQYLSMPSQTYINTQLFYAPNVELDFTGGSFFRGSMVVNSFDGGGNGEVQFFNGNLTIEGNDETYIEYGEAIDFMIHSGIIEEQ